MQEKEVDMQEDHKAYMATFAQRLKSTALQMTVQEKAKMAAFRSSKRQLEAEAQAVARGSSRLRHKLPFSTPTPCWKILDCSLTR